MIFLSEEYTNKTTGAENLENDHDVKKVDSKKSTLPGQVLQLARPKRAIDSGREHNFLIQKIFQCNCKLFN